MEGDRDELMRGIWLLGSTICPYSQRALICLNQAAINFSKVNVDFIVKPDWFAKLTPFNKVPVLIDDGFCVRESIAIIEYIDEKLARYWLGATKEVRSLSRAWMAYFGQIHNVYRDYFITHDEMKFEGSKSSIKKMFELCSSNLKVSDFFVGDEEKLSGIGIVYAPLLILHDVLAGVTHDPLAPDDGPIAEINRAVRANVYVKNIYTEEYRKEILEFIGSTRSVYSGRYL